MGGLYQIGQRAIADHLSKLAADGLTAKEAATTLGEPYNQFMVYARKHGVVFKRPTLGDGTYRNNRVAECERRYRAGETLAAIAADYGITRERVRQILTRHSGVDSTDGGARIRAEAKKKERQSLRDRDALARWGCTRAQYESLLRIGKEMQAAGAKREKIPVGAFTIQKRNAATRGIGWELTLWQWWRIWEESGCWSQRGRGHGYVMCRLQDEGPYAAGNVIIAPAHFNSSEQKRKTSGLPTGVSRTRNRFKQFKAVIGVNGQKVELGTFETSEAAHAAYLSALSRVAGQHVHEAA